jgi:hypothetical protein
MDVLILKKGLVKNYCVLCLPEQNRSTWEITAHADIKRQYTKWTSEKHQVSTPSAKATKGWITVAILTRTEQNQEIRLGGVKLTPKYVCRETCQTFLV